MGTLRTIFAISVVFTHCWTGNMVLVGGQNAVQLFYIISGFLISFVLVEVRSYKTITAFYLNRYLRLYPIYFVVAILTLAAVVVTRQPIFFSVYRAVPRSVDALLALANTFLFGQDWVMFSGIKHDSLVFSTDFSTSDVLLFHGLLVPQAWTLGVELTFYLIAPFVLPKKPIVYGLLVCSIIVRICLLCFGLGTKDPWTFRFFPSELALFLSGSIAHQVLLPFYRRRFAAQLDGMSILATALLVVFSLTYSLIPIAEFPKTLLLLALFLLLIPFAFIFQDHHRIDNWIGNLSYPIYIGHMLVIRVIGFTSKLSSHIIDSHTIAATTVLLSIVFAIALNKWVGEPFEAIRRKIRMKARPIHTRSVPEMP